MSPARTPKQPATTYLDATQPPVQLVIPPTPSHRAPGMVSTLEPSTEPRRSERIRRPSTHKQESDAYKAESRGSSRPPTPSKSEPKSSKSKKKKPWGEPGDRPGRIVQPVSDCEFASDEGSPEPPAKSGPSVSDSSPAGQRPQRDSSLDTIGRAEAVRRASAALGSDASRLSTKTIKKLLAAVKDNEEDSDSGPMEIEGGSAPALPQSANQLVMGSGDQPCAGGATGPTVMHGSQTAGQDLEVPAEDNSITEPDSEPEIVELGPGNAASQRIPQDQHTLLYPQPTPIPHTPHQAHRAKSINSTRELDSATVDKSATGSDEESDAEPVHKCKRRRFTPPSRPFPLPPRPSKLHARAEPTIPTFNQPSSSRSTAPSSLPTVRTTSHVSRRSSAVPDSTLSQPPPMSNLGDVLAWAARLAERAAADHVAPAGQPTSDYTLLTQVLTNLRHSELVSPKSLKRKRAEPAEDDSAALEVEAAIAFGKITRPRHKPTLDDYPGFPRTIATLAIPELLATAITLGAYEGHVKITYWAQGCYNRTWERELPNLQVQNAPRPLLGIMSHRVSWVRGKLAERLRPGVETGYQLINPARTREDMEYNRRIVERALPNNFHCPELEPEVNEYQHPALQKLVALAYFWAAESIGATYHDMFNPIPIPAFALVLTITQHCLQEWRTGRLVRRELNIEDEREIYRDHLQRLLDYEKTDTEDSLLEFRTNWFWYGIDYAGVAQDRDPVQPVTRADRVRANSPASDSNAEFGSHSSAAKPHHRHHHHHHRHRSASKGKGRAVE
ncbi:hypothetical protein FRC09_019400 [Ceratobasidium sp. 395]|nr:hypothetical protein FRC09_019400 [Ceratobasidium sp. 395]